MLFQTADKQSARSKQHISPSPAPLSGVQRGKSAVVPKTAQYPPSRHQTFQYTAQPQRTDQIDRLRIVKRMRRRNS